LSNPVKTTLPASDYSLVEQMLPARLLLEIGIYLQSAAHVELTVWQIIMAAEGAFTNNEANFHEYLEVRKSTPKLVDRFRACAKKCNPALSIRISALSTRIENGLVNRNLAAHGAFFSNAQTAKIGVAHYFSRGKKSEKLWYEVNESINQRQIREAISDIDSILREAVSIRSILEQR
jgi:phosphoribosyl-AMP cyclohydrolase